jgi:hypothetical protein
MEELNFWQFFFFFLISSGKNIAEEQVKPKSTTDEKGQVNSSDPTKLSSEPTSANSRLVLHDLKSIVEPAICKTVSSGL